jgi:hypothetical protein
LPTLSHKRQSTYERHTMAGHPLYHRRLPRQRRWQSSRRPERPRCQQVPVLYSLWNCTRRLRSCLDLVQQDRKPRNVHELVSIPCPFSACTFAYLTSSAPVTVTGAKRKRTTEPLVRPWFTKRENFPSMFVANIQGVSNGCGTLENFDVVFPDPGQSVQTVSGSQFTPPVSCANAAATPAASPEAASASAAAPAPTSTSGSGSGSGNESPAATSVPTVAPGVFASGAASASAAVPVATSAAAPSAAAPSAAAPVASAAPSAAAPPTSSGSAGTQSGPCTNEGDWNCIGGTSFQRCASGSWSAAMQMAAGTSCTPGISSELTMAKRALRFAQPHVRRSFNTWGH